MTSRTVAWRRIGPADEGHSIGRLERGLDGGWLTIRITVDDDGLVVDYEDFAERIGG